MNCSREIEFSSNKTQCKGPKRQSSQYLNSKRTESEAPENTKFPQKIGYRINYFSLQQFDQEQRNPLCVISGFCHQSSNGIQLQKYRLKVISSVYGFNFVMFQIDHILLYHKIQMLPKDMKMQCRFPPKLILFWICQQICLSGFRGPDLPGLQLGSHGLGSSGLGLTKVTISCRYRSVQSSGENEKRNGNQNIKVRLLSSF
jgi:hypothetical protein